VSRDQALRYIVEAGRGDTMARRIRFPRNEDVDDLSLLGKLPETKQPTGKGISGRKAITLFWKPQVVSQREEPTCKPKEQGRHSGSQAACGETSS